MYAKPDGCVLKITEIIIMQISAKIWKNAFQNLSLVRMKFLRTYRELFRQHLCDIASSTSENVEFIVKNVFSAFPTHN